jgi:hypothetical protein
MISIIHQRHRLTSKNKFCVMRPMAAMGSLPERQEFFRSVAKPQDRFQDRASALLMTDDGWEGDSPLKAGRCRLLPSPHRPLNPTKNTTIPMT